MTSEAPESSADVCIAAAHLITTLSESLGILTAITTEQVVDDEMRAVIHEMVGASSPNAKHDLLILAKWFEERPYSNRDAWTGTNAYKATISGEEE